MYVCMYVCMYVYTCGVLNRGVPLYIHVSHILCMYVYTCLLNVMVPLRSHLSWSERRLKYVRRHFSLAAIALHNTRKGVHTCTYMYYNKLLTLSSLLTFVHVNKDQKM